MTQKFDKYPFHSDIMTAENLVHHLKPALDGSKVLRVCYPHLDTDYRNTEGIEERIERAQYLIQTCRMGLSVVPPIVLKDIDTFWYCVDSVWVPWAFREFAAGRLPLMGGGYSRDLDVGVVHTVMMTPVRVIYPFSSYFDNENKLTSQHLKSMFNAILYGGETG